jgi:hypothetical protein
MESGNQDQADWRGDAHVRVLRAVLFCSGREADPSRVLHGPGRHLARITWHTASATLQQATPPRPLRDSQLLLQHFTASLPLRSRCGCPRHQLALDPATSESARARSSHLRAAQSR